MTGFRASRAERASHGGKMGKWPFVGEASGHGDTPSVSHRPSSTREKGLGEALLGRPFLSFLQPFPPLHPACCAPRRASRIHVVSCDEINPLSCVVLAMGLSGGGEPGFEMGWTQVCFFFVLPFLGRLCHDRQTLAYNPDRTPNLFLLFFLTRC